MGVEAAGHSLLTTRSSRCAKSLLNCPQRVAPPSCIPSRPPRIEAPCDGDNQEASAPESEGHAALSNPLKGQAEH